LQVKIERLDQRIGQRVIFGIQVDFVRLRAGLFFLLGTFKAKGAAQRILGFTFGAGPVCFFGFFIPVKIKKIF
jgi:hypothetical protein